jgi:uncharacterized membrane protein YhaH (DUF805 family)
LLPRHGAGNEFCQFVHLAQRPHQSRQLLFLTVIGVAMLVSSSMSVMFGGALGAYVPIVYAGVVSAIKRLHDRNKSGWWVVLFYGAPTVISVIASILDGSLESSPQLPMLLLLQVASLVISIWALVELGCRRGTIGHNRYGPDPLAPEILTPPVRTHA